MPKNSLRDFSSTAGSNTDIQSVDIDENCAASGLNNAIRELMADIADFSAGTVGIDVLSLADDDNSAQIKFQAPSAVTTTTTFTLPDGDGSSGQYLKTNGSGTLSWDTVTSSGAYDLNGGELTLDADGDTSITADTDDRIDFKTAGTDRMHLTSNGSLGIGTASPLTAIHADKSSNASQRIRLQNSEGSADYGTDANRAIVWVAGNQKLRIDSGGFAYLNSEGGSVAYVNVQQGSAKQWSMIDNKDQFTTRDSYNQSSASDTGVGRFTVNINNDMNSTHYAGTGTCGALSGGSSDAFVHVLGYAAGSYSYSNARANFVDGNFNAIKAHGDLA